MLADREFLRRGRLAGKPRRENFPTFPAKKSNLKQGGGVAWSVCTFRLAGFLTLQQRASNRELLLFRFSAPRLAAGNVPSGALPSPPLLDRKADHTGREDARETCQLRAQADPGAAFWEL